MKKGKIKFGSPKAYNIYRNISSNITEQLSDKEETLYFEFVDYYRELIANIVKEVGRLANEKLERSDSEDTKIDEILHLQYSFQILVDKFVKLFNNYNEIFLKNQKIKLSNFNGLSWDLSWKEDITDHDDDIFKDQRYLTVSQKIKLIFESNQFDGGRSKYGKIPKFLVDKDFHVKGTLTLKYDPIGTGTLEPIYIFEFDNTIVLDNRTTEYTDDKPLMLLETNEYKKPIFDEDKFKNFMDNLLKVYINNLKPNPKWEEVKEKSTDKKPKVVRKTRKKSPKKTRKKTTKKKGNPLTITLDYREEDTFINFNPTQYKKHINRFLTLGKGDYRFIMIIFNKERYVGLSPYSFGTDSYRELGTLRVSPIVLGKIGNKEEYTDTIIGVFSTERQLKAEKESIKNILKGKPYQNINFSLKQINNYNHLKIGNTSILIPPYPNGENQELGLGKNYEELWDRKGYGMVCSRIQNVHLFELFFPKNNIEEQGLRDIDRAIGLQYVDGMGMSLFQTDGNYATIISCEYENKEYPTQQQEYIKKYFDTFIANKSPDRKNRGTEYNNHITFPMDMLIDSVKDGGDIYIPISDHRMSLSAKDGGDISPFYSSFYKGFVIGDDKINMPLVGRIIETMKGDKLTYILTKKYIEEAFELAYIYCLQNGYTTAQSWTHTTSNKKFTTKKDNHAFMFFTDDGQCGFKFTDYTIRTNQILNDFAYLENFPLAEGLTDFLRTNIKNIPFGVKKDEIMVSFDNDGLSVYLSGSKNETEHKKNLFKPYYFQRILAVMDKLQKPEITAIASFNNATDPIFVSCFGLDKDITIVMQTRINV